MDFDDYEKAPSKPFNDSRDAEYKAKRKGDEDSYKHSDNSRKSRVSKAASETRHARYKHIYCSKSMGISDYVADSSERDRERDWKKESKKLHHDKLHDRDRHAHDCRGRRRRDKCWSVGDGKQERVDGWLNGDGCGRGGRERFRDLENSRGRARGAIGKHFDKEAEYDDRWLDGGKELGGSRHSKERKKRKEAAASAEPEVDPDRDQRTVFAYQISLKADERDMYDFFCKAGKVRDVKLIMDRNLRRSKGVGYVEFFDAISVPMAIAMTGQLLLGQPVMVKPSEAEKNLVQSTVGATGAGGTMGPYNGGARRLYVGNLHYDITKKQLRQVFESFGRVEFVQLSMDSETMQSKGYAFIQFARHEDAQCAQMSLNGTFELAGRVIKALMVMEQMNMQEPGSVAGELDGDDSGSLTDADFDLDIKDEVLSECLKFGAVKHIHVNKTSAGHVYLRMDQLSAAANAQRSLHGRWFAGRKITVTFLTVKEYETKVPDRTRDGSPCIGFLPKQLTV